MKDVDYEKYLPFLGWKPLEVIKRTFEATTQLAAATFSYPMKYNYKSQFPIMNCSRLQEMFCTDTWFGCTPAPVHKH